VEHSGSPSIMHSYSVPKLQPASPPKKGEFNEETFIDDEQQELRRSMNSVGFDEKGGIVRSNVTYYGDRDLIEDTRNDTDDIDQAAASSHKIISSRSKLKKSQKLKQRTNEEPSPYAAPQIVGRPSSRGDSNSTKLPRIPSPANAAGGGTSVSASKFFLGTLKS